MLLNSYTSLLHKQDISLVLTCSITPCSNYCKYLGVTLQSDLKWDQHTKEKIACKCKQYVRSLRRNIKVSSAHIKELAYKALVRPKLEYACTVWSPWQQYLIDNIEKV